MDSGSKKSNKILSNVSLTVNARPETNMGKA